MKVCVVGSGAREHALAATLARTAEVVVTPGNPGIEGSVSTPPTEIDADLVVIGPEAPLVDGLADRLRAIGRRVVGPGADGALLEGSKVFMKELLVEAGLPTAAHSAFTEVDPAFAYLDRITPPYVVKTDGLAAGKGVLVTESLREARNAVEEYISGSAFGPAGQRLVIEEGLVGPELSFFALCDGRRGVLFPFAQDHKRIHDGDRGPNTGGMGAYSPVATVPDGMADLIMEQFLDPTMAALRARGIDYRGFLYGGLMLTPDGPKMLEYNVRFGDPECQVVVPRIESDLAELMGQAADGRLVDEPVVGPDAMVTVVCASEGYPASPRTGDVIVGLDAARAVEGVTVFCAGVGADDDGRLITAGGRVLSVTGRGDTVAEARTRAYVAVDEVSWPGMQARRDIAAGS